MMMNNNLQSLKIICRTLIIGVLMFLAITFLLKTQGSVPFAADMNPMMMYAGIAVAIVSVPISFTLFNKRSDACKTINDDEKNNFYRAAVILQYALLEGPALFNIIAYMLAGNIVSVVIAGLCLLVMINNFPNEEKYNRFGE